MSKQFDDVTDLCLTAFDKGYEAGYDKGCAERDEYWRNKIQELLEKIELLS